MKKLRSCKGETLVEVLISIIVLSLCFIILQTSIVTSNRMNKQSKDAIKVFNSAIKTRITAQVVIKKSDGLTPSYKIGTVVYQTEDGYYYYGE